MSHAVETVGLTYRYASGGGVAGVDLKIPRGAIYAFIGANGSGKTTTIRLLLGLLRPQAGLVEVLGSSRPDKQLLARQKVGALIESPSLYPHLSGRDNLEIVRRLTGVPASAVLSALDDVGLGSREADRRVREYSLGMKQRLGLALALIGRPELLLLDEPGNGLDPAGALQMRLLVAGLARDRNMTVLLSSHLLGEVERIASHVGIIHAGRLRYQGSLHDLTSERESVFSLRSHDEAAALLRLKDLGFVASGSGCGEISLRSSSVGLGDQADAALLRMLVEAGVPFHAFHRSGKSLEARFFEIVGGVIA